MTQIITMYLKMRYLSSSVFFQMLTLLSLSLIVSGNTINTDTGHPGLIITRGKLNSFLIKSTTTHKDLYLKAISIADEFLKRPLPKPRNASNNYREIGETMPALGLAYLMTKDEKYLSAAEKWINTLLDVSSWNGSQNLGRSAWVTGIAQLYDWLYNDLDKDLKIKIINRLKAESEIIIKSAARTRALSNHLMIETSAVGTLGLILPPDDPAQPVFLKQADAWTKYIIENAPLDGSWGEGIQYWEYGLGYFLRYLEGARTSGYKDYFIGYSWLKKTGRFLMHFSVPGNLTRVINFGDCGSDRYIPGFLLYLPAAIYRDAAVQDYALKVQPDRPHKFSWMDFLTYDATLKPVDYTSVENEFHHFQDNGFVTMRSSWRDDATLVGFRCGPAPGHANQAKPERVANNGYGPGHQHPDINNFVIYSNGTWLAIDPGYVHLKETRDFNTILVNGKGQAGAGKEWLDFMAFENRTPAPAIKLAETTAAYDYVIGDAGNIYVDEARLRSFERHIMFIKPDIIIIADRLKSNGNSTFTWSLQANEVAVIKKMASFYEIKKERASLSVFPVLPADLSSEVTERKLNGSDVHGDPDFRGDEALLRTIKLISSGTETNFLVVLTVNKPGDAETKVSFLDSIISITKGNRNIKLKYQPKNDPGSKIIFLQGEL